jgi:formate--tetrahydrofolate ligase
MSRTGRPTASSPAAVPLLRPILEVAGALGIDAEECEPYGRYKVKVSLSVRDRVADRPAGRYVVVTAITPTPLGEGKTVTALGLAQALRRRGGSSMTCLREPSLGPVFGIKGGGAGGGRCQVVPMQDVNLPIASDAHAVGSAHNLLAAFLDNHLHFDNRLRIDPASIAWPRVSDVSDRALREVRIGLGPGNGPARDAGFDITAASEVMAILSLAGGLADLRGRLDRVVVARTDRGQPVTAGDLRAAGPMAALLREAIKPNLFQDSEGGPVFIHTGPFGNIAHGSSSIVADQLGVRLADYVVTEAGFGADLGGEKFMDIKCRVSGLRPDCVVLVASVRALKMHSGRFVVRPGLPLDDALLREDLESLALGMSNLEAHIEGLGRFGVPIVVAVNRFPSDTDREHALVAGRARTAGAVDAVVHDAFELGGAGAEALADAVAAACDLPNAFRFLYPDDASLAAKIETVAVEIYGADGVDYRPEARDEIDRLEQLGFGRLPVCLAKTHLSLSHDPALKGRPRGFRLPVRDVRVSAGAGFVYPICGSVHTMPGLPRQPAGERIDIDANGEVAGLS